MWKVTGENIGGKLFGVAWHETLTEAKKDAENWRFAGLFARIEWDSQWEFTGKRGSDDAKK